MESISDVGRSFSIAVGFIYAGGRILVHRTAEGSVFRAGLWSGLVRRLESEEPITLATFQPPADDVGIPLANCVVGQVAAPQRIEDRKTGQICHVFPVLILASPFSLPPGSGRTRSIRWIVPEKIRSLRGVPRLGEMLESLLGNEVCEIQKPLRDDLDAILLDHASESLDLAIATSALIDRNRERSNVSVETIGRLVSLGWSSRFAIANTVDESLGMGGTAARGKVDRSDSIRRMMNESAKSASEGLRGCPTILVVGPTAVLEAALHWWLAGPGAREARLFETRPSGDGTKLAGRLTQFGRVRTVLYPDAAIWDALQGVDLVLVGADAVFRDGSVAARVGATPTAICARAMHIPVMAVAAPLLLARSEEQEARWHPVMGPIADFRPALPKEQLKSVGRILPVLERLPGSLLTEVLGIPPVGS